MEDRISDRLAERRVMVVDDDRRMARTVSRILEQWGLCVETVFDAGHAVNRAEASVPGLVLLDLRIGAHDGVEVMHHLSTLSDPPAVILMSGVDPKLLETVKVVGEELGLEVIGTLSKPFQTAELQHLLDRPRLARVVRHQPALGEPTAAELHGALCAGEVVPHYQPKVNLVDGSVAGVEALARWHHPRLGLLGPERFLAVSEHSSLAPFLTEQVISQALTDLRQWDREGGRERLSMSVNVPPCLLEDEALPGFVAAELGRHAIPAERLVLEVVETGQLNDTPAMRQGLSRLRLLGVQVAMDDFGTGLSTLKRLFALPFTMLKLDKSFITPLLHSAEARVIVHQTLSMARELNLATVAEGIEDGATFELLAQMGCDMGQGYHMGRPMPAADFARWRTEWSPRKGDGKLPGRVFA